MMRKFAVLFALAILAGCSGSKDETAGALPDTTTLEQTPVFSRLNGTLTYRQRIALPDSATVSVILADVSLADAPAIDLGMHTFVSEGRQVPLPFSIEYDPALVDPAHTYAVRARIDIDGKLAWTSDTVTPVITRGAPSDSVEVILVPVKS